MEKIKTEYEIVIWIGCEESTRDINYFDVTSKKQNLEALEWFQEMAKESIENNESGMPYFSVYKWIGTDQYEYGDSLNGGYCGVFSDLPKYVQMAIKPLINFQNTITY